MRRRPLQLVRRARRARAPTRPRRAARGIDIHALLQEKAARLRPGESGLLALDWWNGNRSVLVDAELGGLLIGATPGDHARGDLPGADRGDRVRDAGDHRDVRGARRADPRDRRLRRAGREEPADHADLRRRDRPAVQAERVRPDAGPRLGDVRGGRRRCRGRRPSDDRGRGARDGPAQGRRLRADRRRTSRSTTSSIASTSGCTTTSAVARTTS